MCPGDGLPSNVCPKCVQQANTAYDFKKKCEASDSKLRVHLCKMQDFQVISFYVGAVTVEFVSQFLEFMLELTETSYLYEYAGCLK
jgi:hypothetical protein